MHQLPMKCSSPLGRTSVERGSQKGKPPSQLRPSRIYRHSISTLVEISSGPPKPTIYILPSRGPLLFLVHSSTSIMYSYPTLRYCPCSSKVIHVYQDSNTSLQAGLQMEEQKSQPHNQPYLYVGRGYSMSCEIKTE